jgi:hypothetical protein
MATSPSAVAHGWHNTRHQKGVRVGRQILREGLVDFKVNIALWPVIVFPDHCGRDTLAAIILLDVNILNLHVRLLLSRPRTYLMYSELVSYVCSGSRDTLAVIILLAVNTLNAHVKP